MATLNTIHQKQINLCNQFNTKQRIKLHIVKLVLFVFISNQRNISQQKALFNVLNCFFKNERFRRDGMILKYAPRELKKQGAYYNFRMLQLLLLLIRGSYTSALWFVRNKFDIKIEFVEITDKNNYKPPFKEFYYFL
ncbi:unnamed protein product [Paramecium octaurelia]|uniref:Uncharacterized protein n=1 Tax=Paramecium octaurelia TaxID=43137 RepID=A0A8S1YNR6_PAROT|nr:unnamed protein product [Paramecium octaurelia]